MARVVGFTEVSTRRPDHVSIDELQRAQWVRAFLGEPVLVLLERPESGAGRDNVPGLFGLVDAALSRGAAVLWTTSDRSLWEHERWSRAKRFAIRDGRLTGDREER